MVVLSSRFLPSTTTTTITHYWPLFSSPVNDLLDRGNYTLQELLDEDDVLQEVKAMNTRLVDL